MPCPVGRTAGLSLWARLPYVIAMVGGLRKRIALARAHRLMLEHNLKQVEADLLRAEPAKQQELRERYDMHVKALRFTERRESWLAARQPKAPTAR